MPLSRLSTFNTLSSPYSGLATQIGFIGQGWIGKNYADDFERRGYATVRYALEEPYRANKELIKDCGIVFIAVPTPTTPQGFDASAVRAVLPLVGDGRIAVIKSTLTPGTTRALQSEFPNIVVFHSPEFLSRPTAEHDAAHPYQNIIGMPHDTAYYRTCAKQVVEALPAAPGMVVSSDTSELFKYVHNTALFVRSLHMNLLYDVAQALGVPWADIQELIKNDPMLAARVDNISHWHITPAHKGGRGIGGDCHIKDFETFSRFYADLVKDPRGQHAIDAFKDKNIELLLASGKDLDLVHGVYGRSPLFAPRSDYRILPPLRWAEWVVIAAGLAVVGVGVAQVLATLAGIF
jgi:hypothetical protein